MQRKIRVSDKHSLTFLHHLRWLAALEVAAAHIRIFGMFEQHHNAVTHAFYFVSGLDHSAVLVFFVLSGFLVGGKTMELYRAPNIESEWKTFLADRFSRIFTVLVPALVLTLFCFVVILHIAGNSPFVSTNHWSWAGFRPGLSHDANLVKWIGALFLLNGFGTTTLGSNSPLWSLSLEWFYYMAALAAVLALRRQSTLGALCIIFYAMMLLALCIIFKDYVALALGVVWVFGLVAKYIFDRRLLQAKPLFFACVAITLVLLVLVPFHSIPDQLLGFFIAAVLAHRNWDRVTWGNAWGEKLAGFSYSLYLTHLPVLLLAMAVCYRLGLGDTTGMLITPAHMGVYLLALAVLIFFGWLFSLVTEANTRKVRNFILRPAGASRSEAIYKQV
jgi:peptidoglycan/LPS O-acetylase OafA/YrhL